VRILGDTTNNSGGIGTAATLRTLHNPASISCFAFERIAALHRLTAISVIRIILMLTRMEIVEKDETGALVATYILSASFPGNDRVDIVVSNYMSYTTYAQPDRLTPKTHRDPKRAALCGLQF